MKKIQIKLLPHQYDAIQAPSKNTLLLGGVGSGKTFAGGAFVYKNLAEQPNSIGFIGANTYQQLRDVCIPSLLAFFELVGLNYSYNKVDSIIYVGSTKILCRSLDKYDNFRGIEIGWYWLDEIAYAKKEAFDVVIGRLRDPKARRHHGLLTTTPKGYNWLYDYFHPNGELNTPDFHLIKAKSKSNKHLPDGYLDSLKSQYDEKLIEQELDGEFINITSGKVYYAFDRDVNVKECKRHSGTVFVGLDFNVDPFCGVLVQFSGNTIYVFDEYFERNSDTPQTCFNLIKRGYGGATIIPDSTAKNRKTSGQSDITILKNSGFKVEATRNPFVFDRVNNLNRLLSKGRIIIDPKCKKLINDLEKVTWKGSDLDQKSDHLLTHVSDSLGYIAHWRFPIKDNTPYTISTQGR